MGKIYFLFCFSILYSEKVFCQNSSDRTEIDTIEVFPDKVLVNYKYYKESTLTEFGQAFLYSDTLYLRKSKWLPGFVRTACLTDSMVFHGNVRTQNSDGKYRIGKYINGNRVEMSYFDSTGAVITAKEFYDDNIRSHREPEQGYNIYLIQGIKNKK